MVKEAVSDLDLLRDLGVVLVAVDVVEDAGLDPGAGVGLPGGGLDVGLLLAEPAAAARLALALVTLAAAPPTAQLRPRPLVPAARRARGAGAVLAGPSLETAAEEHNCITIHYPDPAYPPRLTCRRWCRRSLSCSGCTPAPRAPPPGRSPCPGRCSRST